MSLNIRNLMAGSIALGVSVASMSSFAATILSKAQQEVVDARIAELQTSEDRTVATEWSDAKKVAEIICSPLAARELKKWNEEADRVFLGTDDPATLQLSTNRLLTGSGQVRAGDTWTDFSFECELDPETGQARSFTTSISSR